MSCLKLIPVLAACGMLGVIGPIALAAGAAPSRLYEVTTETSMPHLDENLRYATRTEERCLDIRDLSGEFWMLREVSLQDCRLVKVSESADAAGYLLMCDGGHGTTGTATWQLGRDAIAGTLNVRLGGKNMTFYQRITAKPIGFCG
jgi:hypothetical protein